MDRSRAEILLVQPKFPVNLANVVRGAACFGVGRVIWTGQRLKMDTDRLPRELRMRSYATVKVEHGGLRPFDLTTDLTPVCVEFDPSGESLSAFDHPPKALYVFGPEDGSVPTVYRRLCHRFVRIPSLHCLNLAAAVNIVLFHRQLQFGDQQ